MRVLLKPGETLEVGFYEDEPDLAGAWNALDGNFTIEFEATMEGVTAGAIRIHADYPDSTGREGLIYEEIFGHPGPKEAAFYEAIDPPAEQPVSAEMQKAMDEAMRESAERPVPAYWRQTQAEKLAGDAIVARNLREKFKPHLDNWTDDTALADQFEVFRTSTEFLERGEDAFPAWLEPVEPEPGEHAEVIDALKDC